MKGKAAAQNANRRTAVAVERAEALAAALSVERESHAADVRRLEAEIRDLRVSIETLAECRTRERIAQAEAGAFQAVAQAKTAAKEKARNAVDALHKWNVEHPHDRIIDDVILAVANAAGVSFRSSAAAESDRVFFGLDNLDPNRAHRRLSNKGAAKANAAADRAVPNHAAMTAFELRRRAEKDADGEG